MSRSNEMLRTIPPTTLGIIGLCSGVYVCQLVFDPDLHHYTMCPRPIIYLHEFYRFITSTLFHGSIMHIGMNMVSTAAISTMLEKRFGTLRHLLGTLWAILLTSLVYTTVAVLLHILFGVDKFMYEHSVGFSGVLFHMSVLESSLTPHRARSVFGFITVPSYLYPWALLVALQVFMPNLSFLGHLSGILTGTLQLYGVFDPIMVSEGYLQHMEGWSCLRIITSRSNFVKTPNSLESGVQLQRDPASLRRALWNSAGMVLKFIKDVAETIKVCIFGHGREANANIQLGSASDGGGWGSSPPSGSSNIVGSGDGTEIEDDDWVGLPPMPAPEPDVESRMV